MTKNTSNLKYTFFLVLFLITACANEIIIVGPNDPSPLPTAPSSLQELVISLSSADYRVRLAAIYALSEIGPSAEPAVDALTQNLSHDFSDVRVASADALGAIEEGAKSAVPALIKMLCFDEYVHARVSAAKALGKIGDTSAVPFLADILTNTENYKHLSIASAFALAQLTNQAFPDSQPGTHGYQLNENGEPLLVIAAREWWQKKGQYQDWGK